MLLFCPHCSNIVRIEKIISKESGKLQQHWLCPTCPYQCPIEEDRPFIQRTTHVLKKVDAVVGGPSRWENASKTDINCPVDGCDGAEAFFYQIQIRSADEPMTTFYKCALCLRDWREG